MEHDMSEMLENIRTSSPDVIKQLRRSVDIDKYLPGQIDEEADDPQKEVDINFNNGYTCIEHFNQSRYRERTSQRIQ